MVLILTVMITIIYYFVNIKKKNNLSHLNKNDLYS